MGTVTLEEVQENITCAKVFNFQPIFPNSPLYGVMYNACIAGYMSVLTNRNACHLAMLLSCALSYGKVSIACTCKHKGSVWKQSGCQCV